MTPILIAFSMWLHALATVVFIGYYVLLSLIYLPGLATSNATILSEISKRSRAWLYVSLLNFLVTGTYLTFADPSYLGLGNFGNLWAILMLVKHILIVGMIAIGFWFNAVLHVGPRMSSNNPGPAVSQFRLYVSLMAISGIIVLLLTALAQVE